MGQRRRFGGSLRFGGNRSLSEEEAIHSSLKRKCWNPPILSPAFLVFLPFAQVPPHLAGEAQEETAGLPCGLILLLSQE